MSVWYAGDDRLKVGWRFLLGVVVVFAANVIAFEVAAAIGGRSYRLVDVVYRPFTMVLLIVGFSFLLVTADEIQERPLAAMGLPRDEYWWRDALLGIVIGAAMIALAVAAMIAFHASIRFDFHLTRHSTELAIVELFVLLTGAMTEELMFRGYPFQRLLEAVGPARAILLLSFLFGTVHLDNPHATRWAFINTIAVGVLFAIAYLKTRALWLPWGIHFGWNTALGMGFGLPVSGLNDFSVVVRATAKGPLWVTGGDYGLEASAVGTVVIALGLVLVSLLRMRPEAEARLRMLASLEASNSADQSAIPRIQS